MKESPGADGVHDGDRRGRDGDALAVRGREGTAPSEGDDDEAGARGVPAFAGVREAGTGGEEGTVVFAEAEDVRGRAGDCLPLREGAGLSPRATERSRRAPYGREPTCAVRA